MSNSLALNVKDIDYRIFYGNLGYKTMGYSLPLGILYRIATLLASFIVSSCFFSFLPKKKNKLTYIGRNTLLVYLTHGIIVRTLIYMGIMNNLDFWILFLVSILTTLLFSISYFNKKFKVLVVGIGTLLS